MTEASEFFVDPRLEAMLEAALLDCPDSWPLPHLEVEEAAASSSASPAEALDPGRLLLDVQEAARRLGCSRSLLYELIGAGELGFIKIGRLTRIPLAALEDLIARRLEAGRRSKASKKAAAAAAAYPATVRGPRRGRRQRGDR